MDIYVRPWMVEDSRKSLRTSMVWERPETWKGTNKGRIHARNFYPKTQNLVYSRYYVLKFGDRERERVYLVM